MHRLLYLHRLLSNAIFRGDFIYINPGSTTFYGTPTNTAQPAYGTGFSEAVGSATDAAFSMITASPNALQVLATYTTTVDNVETLAICIVDSDGGAPFSATPDDEWEIVLSHAGLSYIFDLDVVGEANYLILTDLGNDASSTQGYIDLQIATSTVTSSTAT